MPSLIGIHERKQCQRCGIQINISHERPEEGPKSGPITVGWFRTSDKGGVLYDAPERLASRETNKGHAKSATRCPALINMESRYFVIKCPIDMSLGFMRDEKGIGRLVNRAGASSAVRSAKLADMITLINESEWRHPDRPTIQMKVPYMFVADEPVYLTQLAAFAHYRRVPLPGTIFGGRFPIDIWPRSLMWAFEWHEPEKDIVLKRGEPQFYVQFEGDHPDRSVSVVEAERTAELDAYVEHISGVVNYLNQTFSLFKAAEAARPKTLVRPKKRDWFATSRNEGELPFLSLRPLNGNAAISISILRPIRERAASGRFLTGCFDKGDERWTWKSSPSGRAVLFRLHRPLRRGKTISGWGPNIF